MTAEEIKNAIYGAQVYGNRRFGATLFDQARNARAGLDALNDLNLDKDSDEYKNWESSLKADLQDANINKYLTAAQATGSLIGDAISTSKINDAANRADIINIGTNVYRPYASNASLAQGFADWENSAINPTMEDYSTLGGRGFTKQKAGVIGGSMMAGAALGTEIMPGWGTVIGAGIGGIAGGVGVGLNGANARRAARRDSVNSLGLLQDWHTNLTGQALMNEKRNASQKIVRSNSCGGHIARRRGDGGLIVTFRRNKK